MGRSPPIHTPYDGSSRLFTIGLKPLDPNDWIEPDRHLDSFLAEKDRLSASLPDKVFVAEPGSEPGQQEVLDLVAAHLPARFPAMYRRLGDAICIGETGRSIDLAFNPDAPLRTAARLVQEDLVLMRKDRDGWRLGAASLSFPSSWTLAEKFGRPLRDIHAPVPSFGPGTRTADLIDRIFDNLAPDQPVQRWNWSLQTDLTLYLPFSGSERDERAAMRPARFPGEDPVAAAFIRVERQTLRKLPASGDILFTIRIHLDPMAALANHEDRARIALSFASQLEALDAAQLDYKGLTADRERLAAAAARYGRGGRHERKLTVWTNFDKASTLLSGGMAWDGRINEGCLE